MKKANKIIYILFAGCVIALIMSITQCRNRTSDYEQSKAYIQSKDDTIVFLKNGVAKKESIHVSENVFKDIVEENDYLKQELKKAHVKIKNVQGITTIYSNTKIDTIKILLPGKDIPYFVPFELLVDSTHYQIHCSVSNKSISFNEINFPDSLSVISAKKNNIFKKDQYIVSVRHSNPYIKTIGLTNLTITESKRWYDSPWLKFSAGVLAGGFLVHKISK